MARHLLRASTALSAAKPPAQGQPGSNGYWRRQIWDRPGTFTWTAQKDGRVKIQAIGAASGGSASINGNPGHYGEKTLNVLAGQTLTIVVGAGGDGSLRGVFSNAGQTTSISGAPVGGTALALPGAPGVRDDISSPATASATLPSGPWDKSFGGGVHTNMLYAKGRGGPASASPFGPGVFCDAEGHGKGATGGNGWGGPSRGSSGASSHRVGLQDASVSAWGKTTRGGTFQVPSEVLPFWDLEDVDSGGGIQPNIQSPPGYQAGAGAGGAASNGGTQGTSYLGGGTGFQNVQATPVQGGNGAAGVAGYSTGEYLAGKGGNGYVQLFWDEVA